MRWKILKYFMIAFISLGVISAIGVAAIIHKHYLELPNVSELIDNYSPSEPTTIYDRNGQIIDVISRENREPVDIDSIPEELQNAFISIEDRRFYSHYGIDPIRIMGALAVNLKSGRATQGGSTITQQLAKNAFLSHEKKLSRKIKELIITLLMERKFTKEEIMEKYLNEIYFASGAYGVKSASDTFFRKDVTDINLAEAALLAGITNNPNKYNPRTKLDNSLSRQNIVLSQMLKYGYISDEEYKEAIAHKFVNESNATESDYNNPDVTVVYRGSKNKVEFNAPEFTDLVEKFLFENFTEAEIYNNGLKVYTTLDLNYQKVAKEVFDNYPMLKNDKKLQGAMITLDSKSGEIVSIIGGKNFKTSNFNRATSAVRQLGSSFKPFVYFTALEKGYEENLVVEDSKSVYKNWAPRNFGEIYYNGITLMQGFDKSQNVVSVKLLKKVGVDSLLNTLEAFNTGIEAYPALSSALGTAEGNPLQLASSYIPFANGGTTIEPTTVRKVVDKFNNTIYTSKPLMNDTFESGNISLMLNMFKNSVKDGTSRNAKVTYNDKPIEQGGKTGTTNNSRTVWYAGFTPDYITTIYLGYDDNSPVKMKNGKGATGGGAVAPLWKSYYQKLIDEKYYVPTRFEFLDNHIKNGDLFYQSLDPLTGMIRNSKSNKEFLLRRGKMVVESSYKYENGISGVLGYHSNSNAQSIPSAIQDKVAETEKSSEQNIKEEKVDMVEPKDNNEGFFKNLFHF